MSTCKRTFFDVGQALFSVERRGTITIVYDCGGQNVNTFKKALANSLKKGETIDALFISHYDRDHINGVPSLLKFCTVKHLFLPMVDEPKKLYALSCMNKNTFSYQFTLSPKKAITELIDGNEFNREPPCIHFIKEEDDTEDSPYKSEFEHDNGIVDINSIHRDMDFNSGTTFSIGPHRRCCWIYRLFNRKYMNKTEWKQFLSNLGLPSNSKCHDVLHRWESTKLNLKSALIMANVVTPQTINEYSMTLYSGPIIKCCRIGCLYLGDYDAKHYFNELKRAYVDVWNNISVIQVPHHGSKNNYNTNLQSDHPNAVFVIPAKNAPYNKNGDVDPSLVISLIGHKARPTYNGEGVTEPFYCRFIL